MKDLNSIMSQDTTAMGFSIAPKNENYYVWEVRFFDFDDCELGLSETQPFLSVLSLYLYLHLNYSS